MTVLNLDAAARLATDRFAAAPVAVVAAARRRAGEWIFGIGASGGPADTVFDLASVTKPVTSLAFARLERRGVIRRAEALHEALPHVAHTAAGAVPLDLLLAHRGGLEAHRKLFAPLLEGRAVDRAAAIVEAADSRRDDCAGAVPAEGFAPVYSDMGYLLVGEAMAARAGRDLDAIIDAEIAAPLGLQIRSARQWERVDPARFARVAPTERADFRGGIVRGRVHDENAFAIAGDASAGHAGLFGDARDVARLGVAVLDGLARRSDFLTPAELAPLVRRRPGGSHRAGFDGRSGDAPSSGARFGPETFGHLGFTGTSIWMDPEAALVGVLLTNRVNPTREHTAIRQARPAVYDAIFEAMT